MGKHSRYGFIIIATSLLFYLGGCATSTTTPKHTPTSPLYQSPKDLKHIAYSVQVGSFKNPNNAWNFVEKLNKQGLDAFLFKAQKTYKVRFGNYSSKEHALKEANALKAKGYFDDFFIVNPQSFSINKKTLPKNQIQKELYESSYGYIGVPYKWGGTNDDGFDCSGLTHTVYRLNGISIPRTSIEQFKAGKKINKQNLQIGDLVFFATKKKNVNHVGIYVGNGTFIHAPRRGKTVRTAKLDSKFWKQTYRGARRYL